MRTSCVEHLILQLRSLLNLPGAEGAMEGPGDEEAMNPVKLGSQPMALASKVNYLRAVSILGIMKYISINHTKVIPTKSGSFAFGIFRVCFSLVSLGREVCHACCEY